MGTTRGVPEHSASGTLSRDDQSARNDFGLKYAKGLSGVELERERRVMGTAFGIDGYTTPAQAEGLAAVLQLGPDALVLDIGSGRGWPGLYLSRTTGCAVVLTDLPLEGLRDARRAARPMGSGRNFAIVASPRRLPFKQGTFDAVVHTDVLC